MDRIIAKEELDQATHTQQLSAAHILADGKTVVKTGGYTRVTEATTMRFIREKTSIPVPEVYNVYKDEETGYVRIVMEYIPGKQLDHAWAELSEDEKESVAQQLRGYFNELRQIKGTFIGSIDETECEDQLFPDELKGWGPYADEAEFNQGLIKAWMRRYSEDPFICMLCRMLESVGQGHEIVFTHNDFAARNILVQGSKVVAILDWELSGFYPEYWEYCKALWRPEWDGAWIKEGLVDRALQPYLKEAAVILHTSYRIW